MAQSLEALCNKYGVDQGALRYYLMHRSKRLLRKPWHNRNTVTGLIGDWGSGKSVEGANIAFRDYMLLDEPCWSNLQLKITVDVSDEEVARFGINGGKVVYESLPFDVDVFLRNDGAYSDGVYLIDEPNMELFEARRSTSNVNLYANRVGQQLRKDRQALIFMVIDEMWVDPRLRGMSDLLIQTRDTAHSEVGIRQHKKEGLEFEWRLYPLSRKFCGQNYKELGGPLGPIRMPGRYLWGIIDTLEKQAEGQAQYSRKIGAKQDGSVELEENKAVMREYDQWGWLYKKMEGLRDSGVKEILTKDMWAYLGETGYSINQLGAQLKKMGIEDRRKGGGKRAYVIPDFKLDAPEPKKKLEVIRRSDGELVPA